jgi:small GTP-binding protein
MMSDSTADFDVFLSYSSEDADIVRPIAQWLRADGLRVWFDEWEVFPGDNISAKTDEGLERSRSLVLCMTKNAIASDWATLESQTMRFRDPLNPERRFIALRLDDTPIHPSLAQSVHIEWFSDQGGEQWLKLWQACRPLAKLPDVVAEAVLDRLREAVIQLDFGGMIYAFAFGADGKRVLTVGDDRAVRLWDVERGECLRVFTGHTTSVETVAFSVNESRAISGDRRGEMRLWDIESGDCLRVIDTHSVDVRSIAWGNDHSRVLCGSSDSMVRLIEVETGQCVQTFAGHGDTVLDVKWSSDNVWALSASIDETVHLWDVETGACLKELTGHTNAVHTVSFSSDHRYALSGSADGTVRLWDLETGRCLRVFEGHTAYVKCVSWSSDQRYAVSGAGDGTVRLWDLEMGRCLCTLGHADLVQCVFWSTDAQRVFTGDATGYVQVWNIPQFLMDPSSWDAILSAPEQIQYTNAKVLLVGESGAGKTGLSKVLAGQSWEPSDSTVGAWATQWKLSASTSESLEREIWLWDFGGQADQRLIHQLYMDDTALAVLVFDGQKEDLFETLGQWDRDLTRASTKTFSKLLVAGRVDAGGLRVSRSQVQAFARERGFSGQLFETSAKVGTGCEELKQSILQSIRWEDIPWRSSPLLFRRLKEEIVYLKDHGRVLMRFNDLREALLLRMAGESAHFSDEELRAVITLLSGPGVVWELKFGRWVLLQPERINAYAQAVIQTMREDEQERGCLLEERVLNGDLTYHSSIKRLEADEERFVLLAMHQSLVERGLCLREHTDKGTLLIFPSYYRRERPELVGHPAVLVSYRFTGFLDDIYATLVVRLHHTDSFKQDHLWRYAADFRTLTGRQLGVKLTRRSEGQGELEVYYDPAISTEEKIIFSKYVHEHLLKSARDVVRLRYYVCPHCSTPVENREVAMKRLRHWLGVTAPQGERGAQVDSRRRTARPTIVCVDCEGRVPLWDELEQHFADPETQRQVREMEQQSTIKMDNESKERALVGEVISTVSLAGQISRELTVSDHGIDMEIEFKSDAGQATGRKVYMQLKSGDSYLKTRKRDGAEIFRIEKLRHAEYWRDQPFPVLLVIRSSEGEVRWMEVREYLRRVTDNGRKIVRQIVFEGRRFDVMSVRRWRDKVLSVSPSDPVDLI